MVDRVLPAFEADSGSLALLSKDGEHLELAWVSGFPEEKGRPNARRTNLCTSARRGRRPSACAVVPRDGRGHQQGVPAPGRPERSDRADFAAAHRRSPLLRRLGASWRVPRTFEPEDRDFAVALAQQCAQAMDRAYAFEGERVARELAQAAEQRLSFLSEASRLLSSSLDCNTTLRALADLTVPRLADCCVIELVDEKGAVDRLRIAHTDVRKQEALVELYERFPMDPTAQYGMSMVLRSGQSQLWGRSPRTGSSASRRNDEYLGLFQTLGLRSLILVPLKTVDRVAGVITLIGDVPPLWTG